MQKHRLIDKARTLVEKYQKGDLEKYKFLEQMGLYNELIFFFSERLQNSVLKKIEISEEEVLFTTNNNIRIRSKKFDRLGVTSILLSLGYYEEEEKIIYQLLKDGDIIFDVGANIGWFSLNFAKRLKKALVYAFEPIPETFYELEGNVSLNDLKGNISTQNLGLSDHNGTASFFFSPEESSITSTKQLGASKNFQKITAQIVTLDKFVTDKNIEKIDFLKCDAEGAELNVIEGGKKSLGRFLPILMIELYEEWTRHFGYSPHDVISKLFQLKYRCFLMDQKNLREVFNYKKDAFFCNESVNNFIFLHSEKHRDIITNLEKRMVLLRHENC